MNGIDGATAAALGWPKAKYAWVEHERRWLCDAVPLDRVIRTEHYRDLYVDGTQLRLRMATSDDAPPMMRLSRKADVDPATRLLTSIYLSDREFALLSNLPGHRLEKTRHHLGLVDGATLFVDEFGGALAGLIMAEAEFGDPGTMAQFKAPGFAGEEVTADSAFTGGRLSKEGLPHRFRLR